MKTPKRLQPLVENGVVDEVVSQLMSGKEAQVFVVRCGDGYKCAKVYKEAMKRSFKNAAQYREGRGGRNSRRGRAMAKNTRYGRQELEEAWQSAEVDALYQLARANVRVPEPDCFIDGVLLMELVVDAEGDVAPRLSESTFTAEQAVLVHQQILNEVVKMLCSGIIHGDLSEFNILLAADGPVIIDLPQAVNAAGNNSAKRFLERDVTNMRNFFGQFAPELLKTQYGKEIWQLFERGKLTVETALTGQYQAPKGKVDVKNIIKVISAAEKEALEERRRKTGLYER
jgi:RIO kinase 1